MRDVPAPAGVVVVGVDRSPSASRAVRWAADEAGRRGLALRLVTAYHPDALELVARGDEPVGDVWPDSKVLGRRAVDDAARLVHRIAPDLPVHTVVVAGWPPAALLGQAVDADTLVLGSRGLGPVRRILEASVSSESIARATCPVVVVRESASSTLLDTRIVVGVDTGSGDLALAYAVDQAARRGCGVTAVRTWQAAGPGRVSGQDPVRLEERAREELAQALTRVRAPGVDVRRHVAHGDPARLLVELSKNARLLVLGSRGRDALSALLFGSVSLAVLRAAHCPVAVVRTHPADRPADAAAHPAEAPMSQPDPLTAGTKGPS